MKRFFPGKSERLNIICGLDFFITSLSLGFISAAQFFPSFGWEAGWKWGALIALISIYLICRTNKEKYRAVKTDKLLSLGRNILDTVLNIAGIVFMWVNVYVPVPFSLEAFLYPDEHTVIFPIGAFINGGILLIPSLATNKKILKEYPNK